MSHFEARLLGEPALRLDGVELRLPAKLTALACYLLARGGAHRAELAELLWWPGARHNLRVALHQLRRALPADAWANGAGSGGSVALIATTDLARFHEAHAGRRHEEAVSLWSRAAAGRPHREAFLAGFDLPGAAGFREWLEQERGRLGSLYLDVVWRLADAAEVAGDLVVARAWLRTLLEEDPFDERAHRHAIQLALRAGDPAAALDQYDLCRRVLRTEFGMEPSPATEALAAEARAAAAARVALGGGPERNSSADLGLFGREADLTRLEGLLPGSIVLSIVGPGGVGKSRLAAALQGRVSARFDAVARVPAESVQDADGLLFAVAGAVGVTGDTRQRLTAAVRDRLGRQRCLLLIDGLEPRHEAGPVLRGMLEGLPSGRCLVTSREPLGLNGEVGFRLGGLPEPTGPGWRASPVARLFEDAARRSDAGFALARGDRAALRELTRAVEGLPLGIVLAAALAQAFSLREIARIASERPESLGGDAATSVEDRHRSLERVLATSYESLAGASRSRLAACSVFVGPFDRAAAEAVAGVSVGELARWERGGWLGREGEERWMMHARVHRFLATRLAPADEGAARARHRDHCLGRLCDAASLLRAAHGKAAVDGLLRDLADVRAAWLEASPDALVDAIEPLRLLLDARARHAEAIDLLGHSLARRPPASVAAALHTALASFENRVGRRQRALRRARLAIGLAHRAGDAQRSSSAHWQHAEVLYDLGRYDQANAALDAVLASRGGDRGLRIAGLRLRGLIELGRSRTHGAPESPSPVYVDHVGAAAQLFQQCLALARASGDVMREAEALHDLGYCHYARGEFEVALSTFEAAERRHRRIGAHRRRYIETYWTGVALLMLGRYDEADRALRSALRAADEASEVPKALEIVQAFGVLWWRRGDPQRAAACFLAALATPGLDARVLQGIEAWHLPQLRTVVDDRSWRLSEARVRTLGYREVVKALLRVGEVLPGGLG